LISSSRSQQNVVFNRSYLGVGIYPYVKNWEGENIGGWNSYAVNDIKIMLNLISTKFTKVLTFGMGVDGEIRYTN
jgi:hypothetical protein